MENRVTVPIGILLKGIEEALKLEQDKSILYRPNYVQHSLNVIGLLGAMNLLQQFERDGATITISQELAKQLGVSNVDS